MTAEQTKMRREWEEAEKNLEYWLSAEQTSLARENVCRWNAIADSCFRKMMVAEKMPEEVI